LHVLQVAGWTTAICFPPIGFIIGIIMLAKSKVVVGMGMIILSSVVFCLLCFFAVIFD